MNKRSYLFIVNPASGKGKPLDRLKIIKETMEKEGCMYRIQLTEGVGHAKKLAEEAKEDVIVAVGGDGTINEIANGVKNGNKIIGLLPSGTGNDFVRSLNIPSDPQEALEIILNGKTREINLGIVQDMYFVNVASVGLDAHIADKVTSIKKYITGTKAYIVALIKGLITYKTIQLKLSVDGKLVDINTMLIAFCNGGSYGGGMKIAPMADFNDDLLDICIVSKMKKLKLFILFPSIFKGNHIRYKEVEALRGKEMVLYTNEKVKINIDGEIIEAIENKDGIFIGVSDRKIKLLVR
ncbi:diacylglycerol/lipid kinase family protein [Alkaliphilus serpentinus]|uniref:Diacylglycerol kinase family lipid kinase n=1 Tax=Alkaliphilus serpentinus TaxID=1482731 RepID=A0A833M929_9FIRM|nr:diacylglycerol kinase family protein [Alkaliphilus serpentinus]KAB3532209.1 diacylglycerol kinase family lipid kinase [Alkaliphilus serpentinus]